jgi:anti-anti-sigma factor
VATVELSETIDGGVKVLTVGGEVDLETSSRLREAIDHLAGIGPKRLVVDLTDCSYIDSTGLAVLFHAAGRSEGFAIVAGEGPPREVLEVTGIAAVVPVFETLQLARDGVPAA